jgi:hypothetical protein
LIGKGGKPTLLRRDETLGRLDGLVPAPQNLRDAALF